MDFFERKKLKVNSLVILIIQLIQLINISTCKDLAITSNTFNLFQKTQEPESNLMVHNNNNYRSSSQQNEQKQQQKLKYLDVWYEINEPTILNCSLRVNRDQHVVWHRKYDKLGVHVLTIGSETFISDLRIRPIKQEFNKFVSNVNSKESGVNNAFVENDNEFDTSYHQMSYDDVKYTWNLEIRRLRRDDSALYYCVLNSENAYGQIYKLNVLPQLRILNKSEILFDHHQNKQKPVVLVCKYSDLITNPNEQIKWFFNKIRIKSNNDRPKHLLESSNQIFKSDYANSTDQEASTTPSINSFNQYSIIQSVSYERNESISILVIHNFNIRHHGGRYKCQYKGLIKTVKLNPFSRNENSSNHLVYKQSVYSVSSSSSSLSSQASYYSSSSIFYKFYLTIIFYYLVFLVLSIESFCF